MTAQRRAIVLVLDGVGCGEALDAARYNDSGSNTLGNVAAAIGALDLPNLASLGLGHIGPFPGVPAVSNPSGAWGTMQPASPGKDSTTGHWEIAGLHLTHPFPTYPQGFPDDVIAEFARLTGRPVIGNIPASGTAIIDRFGEEQRQTGSWIVYTSADSVFQIAAHEHVIPLDELYRACETARAMLREPHNVSRVIARPFIGNPGTYERTPNRRDYSIQPGAETLLDALVGAGVATAGVGKVDDLFAGRGISSHHTANNAEGIREIIAWISSAGGGFLLANLVDFDQVYGHRNDVPGFYGALRQFDEALPQMLKGLREGDLLCITADHGNDPTTPSTDHSRERVPLLIAGKAVRPVSVGERATFSDLGATVAEWFGVGFRGRGTSFLSEIIG